MTLTPTELLEGVHDHLKASVTLAHEEDYALLTFVLVSSYAQAIFETVPLVQVLGPAGPELGGTLSQLGCNATCIPGQMPAANAARRLDRLAGLAVIEDLEEMGLRSGEDEFKMFLDQLGASTRKGTASTTWTDPKTLRVENLNLYGVKIVTGAADSLPRPVLRVYTRQTSLGAADGTSPTSLQELRDNLHIWVLENVGRIDHRYRQHNQLLSPQEALRALLTVLAHLLGHTALSAQLQVALALQEREPLTAMSSVQLLHEAVRSLIRQGYHQQVTLKQLQLEMRLLAGDDPAEASTPPSSEWQEPRWVGRRLRIERLIDPTANDERRWLWREQTRIITLEPGFVARTLHTFDQQGSAYAPSVRQPLEFCLPRPCTECPYAGFCSMRARKERS